MKQGAEFMVFLLAATGLHLVPFGTDRFGAAPSAGDAGQGAVTMAASSDALSEMVAQWERPIETVTQIDRPEQTIQTTPQDPSFTPQQHPDPVVRPVDIARVPIMPQDAAPPKIDTSVDQPKPSELAVSVSPRPKTRPVPEQKVQPRKEPRSATVSKTASKTASKRSPKNAQETAAGSGQGKAAGENGGAEHSAKRQAPNPALMKQWGAGIRAAIERRKRYPSGTKNAGKVGLSVAVSSGGALSYVKIRKSSGDRRLDHAALSAVKQARFKPAPRGLPAGVHLFSLSISFTP